MGRSVLGRIYVFWKCKDRKVCIGKGDRGLEERGEHLTYQKLHGRRGGADAAWCGECTRSECTGGKFAMGKGAKRDGLKWGAHGLGRERI